VTHLHHHTCAGTAGSSDFLCSVKDFNRTWEARHVSKNACRKVFTLRGHRVLQAEDVYGQPVAAATNLTPAGFERAVLQTLMSS